MSLSKTEREFLKDFIAMSKSGEKDPYLKLRDKKYSSDYLKVLRHRIRQKEQELQQDLELIEKAKQEWPSWWEKGNPL